MTKPDRKPRVADEIMAGMRELSRIMDQGKTPEQMFTVKTIEVPESGHKTTAKNETGAGTVPTASHLEWRDVIDREG